jgi:hypothetical protein
VRRLTVNRLNLSVLLAAILFICSLPRARAQDDADQVPLGDLARSLRNKPPASETVIDNDNLTQVVDDAESRREAGLLPVLSSEPSANSLHVSSPDVTCSLSFTAKNSSLSDQVPLDELPRSELPKLEGPAAIDGDTLQVSVHNGTSWDVREVLIGLTIVTSHGPSGTASYYGNANFVPAVAGASGPAQDSFQKQPDVTLLLKMKGSAAPSATTIFRTALNFALFPDQEWHWAIVKAKGIPPQATPDWTTQSPENNLPLVPAVSDVTGRLLPASPFVAGPASSKVPSLGTSSANIQPGPKTASH